VNARRDVVVVGGGISALAAAYQLTGGPTPLGADGPAVTVLERDARCGGKLAPTEIAGRAVDAGPDGVLARRPEARTLVEELGHGELVRPVAASGASLFARGRLHALPQGLAIGIPTSWDALRRSHVLSPAGLARALVDVVAPRRAPHPDDDAAIGDLVAAKLGDEVVTTLVDPMLGGIYAGRVRELSAAAVFPQLLDATAHGGSLMHALRDATGGGSAPPAGPAFVSLATGMHSLPDLLVDELRRRGVTFLTGRDATALRADGERAGAWVVDTTGGPVRADGVVVCTPARDTAHLLHPHAPDAAAALDGIGYASVAVVTFAFPPGRLPLPETGTGVLVPPGVVHHAGPRRGERWLTTALTFLDRKWPDLRRPSETLLRASVGRVDDERLAGMTDDEVIETTRLELAELLGPVPAPIDASVTRWTDALPQYAVHHLRRVADVDAAVERLDGIELAGAAYRGLGVPACIASGRAAADRLARHLTPTGS